MDCLAPSSFFIKLPSTFPRPPFHLHGHCLHGLLTLLTGFLKMPSTIFHTVIKVIFQNTNLNKILLPA